MVKRLSQWSSVVVLSLLALTAGELACHKVTVTNTPPGVSATEVGSWYQATNAVKTWSDASLNLTQAAVNLHSAFPNEQVYQSTLAGLGKENQIGLEATKFLQTAPKNFDAAAQTKLAGYLDQGLAALDDATQIGLLQIKNANTKSEVDAALTSLRASLKIIFSLVKPAGTPLPAPLGGN